MKRHSPLHKLRLLISLAILTLGSLSCSTQDEYTSDPAKNFDALWQTLDRNYSFFDLKLDQGKSWQDIYHQYRSRIKDKMSEDELFEVMTKMLAELRDGHVNLTTPFDYGRYWSWRTDYPSNYSADIIGRYLGKEYRIAGGLYYTQLKYNGHTPDSIGYMRLASFANAPGEGNINAILRRMINYKAIILDIRSNGGGNITSSDALARHFMAQPRIVGSTVHKTGPRHSDFSAPIEIRLDTLARGIRWLRPVVVLTNRGVYSAANDFILKVKGLPLVTIMGDRTGGGGGLPMSSELPNGWGVRFSTTQTFDTSGANIELGIDPDYFISMNQSDLAHGYDSIIEGAIAYLKERLAEYRRTKVWRK